MPQRLKVGISACFFHADPNRPIFTGKTLQYVEQSIAHWVQSQGALALVIPSPNGNTRRGDVTLDHYAEALDGLVLEGGSDMWPGSYGEEPLRPSLIVSEVAMQDAGWSLALSVVGAEGSEDPAQVMDRLQREVAAAHRLSSLRSTRRCLARRLLEPGESRFPDLLVHSLAVSRLCWQMVRAAGGGFERAEQAALAGLLHDVGMRELDYERLYRLERPGPEHRRVYRRHVVVGERIVRGVGLDEVAAAIRHHHERWDGTGYPDRLGRDQIPELARLVHVAEVFDVLTSPSSYLVPVPPERALVTLKSGGGAQFDPGMVELLARVAS